MTCSSVRDNRDTFDGKRYEEVYEGTYTDLVRFVVRRGYPSDRAEDVVSEAFMVAWKRLKDLPHDLGECRAWLFGITRRLMLAEQRADSRGRQLSIRIAGQLTVDERTLTHDDLIATAVDLTHAWKRLTAVHQEALSLSVWEGLTGAQAAQVLGISPVAFRIRLSRARRLLKHHLKTPSAVVTADDLRTPTSDEKDMSNEH